MRVLIVDDERFQRDELQTTIEEVEPGCSFAFACNYDEALARFGESDFDIAFLDVSMPGRSGIELACELTARKPSLNVVMVTAFSEYALDALRLFVSGYIVKPVTVDEVRDVFSNLRHPVSGRLGDEAGEGTRSASRQLAGDGERRLRVSCFGAFEVYSRDGSPMRFRRQREKELLAYLICLRGATATCGQICAVLFERGTAVSNASYFRHIVSSLRSTLRREGYGEALVHAKNSYAVDASLISCDYYRALEGDRSEVFMGEFMLQYSWAEEYGARMGWLLR